jgi:saccharopine dehydrogenase-like NADP-dependent oxidoreductase
MKKVLILGAGHVTKPIVDYLTETCGYDVTMAARTVSKAEKIIAGRPKAKVVPWASQEEEKLDGLITEHDIVINMIPKAQHVMVAKLCLKHQKDMVTTSYEIPPIKALDAECRERGILILNELGEDPGMDHFAVQMLLEEIAAEGGKVVDLNSYGSGLPSFKFNNNPMGYKFSWEPKGVFLAAQVAAQYLVEGKPVPVDGTQLFENFKMVDIAGLGTFESYPNKDVTKYVKAYGLPDNVSFYRGLLRFSGYCNNMRNFCKLDLLDDQEKHDWKDKTYRDFTALLIGGKPSDELCQETAAFLKTDNLSDIMMRLNWLGFFDSTPIGIENGSKLDVFVRIRGNHVEQAELRARRDGYDDHPRGYPGRVCRRAPGAPYLHHGRRRRAEWGFRHGEGGGTSAGNSRSLHPRGQYQGKGRPHAPDFALSLQALY